MCSVKEIDASELRARLDGPAADKPVVVDVRTPTERAGRYPWGTSHFALHLLPLSAHELPDVADATLVFYCQSGARSARACAFMRQRGQNNVHNLRGGFLAWQRSGRAER